MHSFWRYPFPNGESRFYCFHLLLTCVALISSLSAGAQCTASLNSNGMGTTYTTTAPNEAICVTASSFNGTITINHADCTVNIGAGVTFSGQIVLTSNASNCTINNNGSIGNKFDGSGILNQASTVTGTTLNNLNKINSQTIRFKAPTTINNGSSSNADATWSAYFYTSTDIAAPLTITNYGAWNGQMALSLGGTITNNLGAVWSSSVEGVATNPLTIINNGTWSGGYIHGINTDFTLLNTAIWSTPISTGFSTPSIAITNSGSWGNVAQVATTGTLTVNNSGTWQNAQFSNVGTTSITNSGAWNNTQVNYEGALTITHSGTAWAATPSAGNNTSSSSLTVTNTSTWSKGISFPAGPNSFTTTAGATTTFPSGENLGFSGATALTNLGTLNLNRSITLPSSSSLANSSSGTVNMPAGFSNSGTLQNQGLLNVTGAFVNSGLFTNIYRLRVTGDFTNSGTISGPTAPSRGSIRATGNTVNSGVFGVTGQLDFCDTGTPANGFDTRGGTVGTATTFCSGSPLPVVLTAFRATRQPDQVQVQWSTAQETDNAYFVVERAADGYTFTDLQQVAGHGTTQQTTRYSISDKAPLATPISYYRLRQVDADGTRTYSPVVIVVTETSSLQAALTLAPNPAQQSVQVLGVQTGTVQLLDLAGRILRTQLAQEQALNLTGVRPGLYLVRAGSRTARLQVE